MEPDAWRELEEFMDNHRISPIHFTSHNRESINTPVMQETHRNNYNDPLIGNLPADDTEDMQIQSPPTPCQDEHQW